jgi:adenylate cyclase 1
MDHAVKASRSHPWNKLRFENDELEELYQRYTHKIQWISVFGVVTLVVMLTGIMAILSLAYNQAATVHVSRYFLNLFHQLTLACPI